MENTGRFELPLIMPSQAQKHVTHNEALTLIDGLMHLAIKAFGETAPPVGALIDDAYLVGASASGDWFGEDGNIAFTTDVGWRFAAPVEGLIALDMTAARMVIFNQAAWKPLAGFVDISTLPKLGINTNADNYNRLALRSNAALLTAWETGGGGTGDLRLTLNKENAGKTGSIVFQTGYSRRAEFGLAGDDDFCVKVSPDGAAWTEALRIDRASGAVTLAGNSVANEGLADMAGGTFKGRASAGTGDPEDLTAAQATALLSQFSTSAKGLVPPSGSASAGFLKADDDWSMPAPIEGTNSSPPRFYAFNDCVAVVNDPNWTYTVSGTGAVHTAIVFGDANAAGAIRSGLGTLSGNRTSISSLTMNCLSLGTGVARYASRVRLASLSDAANAWTLRSGFLDSVTAESLDGVFFRYTDSVNGGRFQAVCRANNVETMVDTGVPAAVGTTYRLEIEVNALGTSAGFTINGTAVATISTNIPNGVGREVGYGISTIRSAGTAAVNSYEVDYLLAEVLFTTPR